ncbi:putative transposase Ptta/En/Spm plant [Arabidopsis thaliana x Arabidopsis arenosa]|uniref:Putative transposase Ptta/En/Spm plant n=1 Tax=Arabidopsis thaliana x Arabidopsis arenosa TaxID=1240361 RepID=A0A8T1ZJI5_9BRAS|nr:putative transposase Ptta/En/Spm plant [Arabidopsis thaliana x Arabidopsis arenosa]
MPVANNKRRGRKRLSIPNVSQRPVGSKPNTSKRKNPLPPQYEFTPAPEEQMPQPESPLEQVQPVRVSPQLSSSRASHFRDYPPPQRLFQSSEPRQQPSRDPRQQPPEQVDPPGSPLHHSQGQSHPSSQGNNFQDTLEPMSPELQEHTVRDLNALLLVPNREKFTTVLSPTPLPITTWFERDEKSRLVRKITKIFTNKFDGPYYSWTCVPRKRQERYFLEFAKTHTWDPLITGTIQWWFEEICGRRMKDMVSNARTSREKPDCIYEDIWKIMVAYWDTEEAQKRSQTYSKCRMSDRNGLGPHIHLSGPKSYQQIQYELEELLGRPVSLGEVFIKTHTRADGSFVDGKAEKIAKVYEKNVQHKLSELEVETASDSDGASRPRELTTDEYTAIFLQSTEKDSRGTLYGVGSLKGILKNGKRKQPGDSASFVAIQEQLKEAQKKIEEQAAENTRREKEQKEKLEHLSLVEKYLRQTDPAFLDFMKTHSAAETTEPLSTGLPPTS